MNKYMFLYYGHWTPTQDMMDAWGNWFASIGDKIVDGGNPFGPGKEITHNGTKDLSPENGGAAGYSIINAESLEAAEAIARTCPIINSVRVYETVTM